MFRNLLVIALCLLTIFCGVLFSATITSAQYEFPRISFIDPYWVHVNGVLGGHNTDFADSGYYWPQMKRCGFNYTVTDGDDISLNNPDSLLLFNSNLGKITSEPKVRLHATGVENEYKIGGEFPGVSYFNPDDMETGANVEDEGRDVFQMLFGTDSSGVVLNGTFSAGDQPYSGYGRTYRFIFTIKMDGDTTVVDTVARIHIWETDSKSEDHEGEHEYLMSRDLWGEEGEKYNQTFYILSDDFNHPGQYEDIDLGTISLGAHGKKTHIEFKWLGTRNLYIDNLWVRDNFNYDLFVAADSSNTYQLIQDTLTARHNLATDPALNYRFYVDEPRTNMYHSYGKVKTLSQARPGVPLNGATMAMDKRYLASFVDMVDPAELLYNRYTLYADTDTCSSGPNSLQHAWYTLISEPRGGSYRGMRAASTVADSAGIPFCMYIQACNETRLNDSMGVWECWYRAPTRNELLCEAHLALCYGAKGIVYFTYPAMKDSSYDSYSETYSGTKYYGLVDLVDANGDSTWNFHTGRYVPNYRWYAAQEINTKIDSLDDVLLNLNWITAFVSKPDSISKYATFVESLASEEFGTDTSYVEIGEFWHPNEGANYLMLVNRRCLSTETQTVTVVIDTTQNDAYILQDVYNHDIFGGEDGVIAGITLDPGEGRLFKLVDSDETWAGTVNVQSSVTIPQSVQLTIEPAAVIKIAPGSVLQVNGVLSAKGSDSDYISFTASNPTNPWSGILFADSSEDSLCIMKNCFIGYASIGIAFAGASTDTIYSILFHQCGIGISCENASPHITSPAIYTAGTVPLGIYCASNSAPNIDSVDFSGNGSEYSKGIFVFSSDPTIRGGTISNFARGINICGGSPDIRYVELSENTECAIACNWSEDQPPESECDPCSAYIAYNDLLFNHFGIKSVNASPTVFYNRIVKNDSVGVFCSGTYLPILGDLSNADSTDDGYNEIFGNLVFDVINEASDTVQAEYNWWGQYPPDSSQFSGLVDYVPALEESPDSTAPEAIADLSVDLLKVPSDSSIVLQWSEITTDVMGKLEFISHYSIYRDTIPGFVPASAQSLAVVSDTTFEYFDSGAVGDAGVNYYYVVKAVDYGANKSYASNMVGEFDKSLTEKGEGTEPPNPWD
jgi:hypothetical protein